MINLFKTAIDQYFSKKLEIEFTPCESLRLEEILLQMGTGDVWLTIYTVVTLTEQKKAKCTIFTGCPKEKMKFTRVQIMHMIRLVKSATDIVINKHDQVVNPENGHNPEHTVLFNNTGDGFSMKFLTSGLQVIYEQLTELEMKLKKVVGL